MSVNFHIRAIPKNEVVLVTEDNIKYLRRAMHAYIQSALTDSLDGGYMHHSRMEVSVKMIDELNDLAVGQPAPINDATLTYLAPVLDDLYDGDVFVGARYHKYLVEKDLHLNVYTEGGNAGDAFKYTPNGTLSQKAAFLIIMRSKRQVCELAQERIECASDYVQLFDMMIKMADTHWLSLSWG